MIDLYQGKLDNQKIKQKIRKYRFSDAYKPSESLIQSIVEQFWFHDHYNSLIADQIFLDYLLKYLDLIKPLIFDRYTYYQYVFDQICAIPSDRKVLQQIALSFEKQMSDAMLPTDFTSLLQSIDNIPDQKFDPAWMEKNHLAKLGKRDEKVLFIWEHHTLTEFLVAEYLINHNEQFLNEFQRLAVLKHEGVTALKPSWSGVLRFLMESKKSRKVVSWFVDFLEKYPDNIDDNVSELLVFKINAQVSTLGKKVFDLIYNSYFEKVTWMPIWTRINLSKFVDKQSYDRLKNDIKEWSNQTETFVRRGNVVSIVEGLLKDKSELINTAEKDFWLSKLIDFANNPNDGGNGVLQRHSMGALSQYKNENIIAKIAQKCFVETRESLVRDEFIEFCIATNPNSEEAINYFIEGTPSIYARHGLYQITSLKGIEYLLSKIADHESFLRVFLDKESIFDEDGSDKKLINNIKKHTNENVVRLLKKLIYTTLRISDYYNEGQSSFLRQIIQLINDHEQRYLFEILTDIKNENDEQKIDRLFWDSRELLALLLTKDNVKEYFNFIKAFPDRTKRDAQSAVYSAKRLNGTVGNLAYQEAVKLKLVKKVDTRQSEKYYEKQEKQRKQSIYKRFLNQLEPKPGQYLTSVFEYFIKNKDEIKKQWKVNDKKRLWKISIETGIRKIDPREFKVKLSNRHEGNSSFTWSAPASYYGDLLEVAQELAPDEIYKHKQNIIDYIPYEFDTGAITNFVQQINDKELEWVNQIMSDQNDDRRYLIPQTYIYLVSEYYKNGSKLNTVKPVLLSFVTDPNIRDYVQRSALEALAVFIDKTDKDTKKILKEICTSSQDQELIEISNGLLISVYEDEKAIDWLISKVKEPLEFEQIEGAHSVGPVEEQLMSMSLAKPLLNLHDEKYLPIFIDLLDHSFKFTTGENRQKYWEYVNYLWKITTQFVDGLKEKGSFIPLIELESWTQHHSQFENINWLEARIKEIKKNYLSLLHPFDKLVDGVDELGKINSPAAQIALFLFKAQLVETRLRNLILGINQILEKKNNKLSVYRKLNSKTRTWIKNLTLSKICEELDNYQNPSIEKLRSKLNQFAHSEGRNRFNHELFNQSKSLQELAEEAKEYTQFAEESLDLIHKVWEDILTIK